MSVKIPVLVPSREPHFYCTANWTTNVYWYKNALHTPRSVLACKCGLVTKQVRELGCDPMHCLLCNACPACDDDVVLLNALLCVHGAHACILFFGVLLMLACSCLFSLTRWLGCTYHEQRTEVGVDSLFFLGWMDSTSVGPLVHDSPSGDPEWVVVRLFHHARKDSQTAKVPGGSEQA